MIFSSSTMKSKRTRQSIIVVAITVISIHFLCIYGDPEANWSSRSLAGFRNLFRNNVVPDKTPSRHDNQYRKFQSNSSLAPKPTNTRSLNKDKNQVSYSQPRNQPSHSSARSQPSHSTQISKRRLSWNSSPSTLHSSTNKFIGNQYNSYSR